MRRLLFSIFLLAFVSPAVAQSARDFVRLGNVAYRRQQYDQAETYYLKSVEKAPSFEAYYNLGNTYVMQQKDSTAFVHYQHADSIGTTDPMRRARNFHNMGNIWYAQGLAATRQQGGNAAGAFQNAVNFYKSSLRCNPDDNETRYNLAMAQYQLKKNQQNQNNQQQKQDKNQEKQDQQKQQNKQDQQQPQKDEQDKKEQPQPKKDEMSDQAAQQLLNSAQQDERGVQRKVSQQQNQSRRSLEKDW